MDSRTKRQLNPSQLQTLIADTLGAQIVSSAELPDGFANAVWRLALADGRDVVLKVSPPPDMKLLGYERHLLRTEALVYRLAAQVGLPMPALLHAGFDDSRLGGDFLILSALDGTPWNHAELPDSDDQELRRELGALLARLHTIRGDDVYGYPYARLTGRTWREAFLVMTGALLDDAVHYGTALPLSLVEIAKIVHVNSDALDAVRAPALVHFDVWPGNVFLAFDGDRPRIQGLIDHERAFWGDPLADFVTPTLFDRLRADDPLLIGYRAAGGTVELTHDTLVRDALYRFYLYLILLVENGPRQYPEDQYARIRDLATEHLLRTADFLRP